MTVSAQTSLECSAIESDADWGEPLEFACPRCGHLENDPLEVIDAGKAVDRWCTGCMRIFSVLLVECERCACETVSVAPASVEQMSPAAVACHACGHRSCDHGKE